MPARPSLQRRLRRSAWLIPLLALGGVLLVNLLCLAGAWLLAGQGFWMENKTWKGLLLQAQTPAPDVVLIGSSRTLNNFDSALMSQSGQRYFNLGLPEVLPNEMPALVELAARTSRHQVVLAIPDISLLSEPGCATMWTWRDVRFYSHYAPRCVELLTLNDWFKLLPISAMFWTATPDVRLYPCQRSGMADELRRLARRMQQEPCQDPRRPLLLRGNEHRSVMLFANGDSTIISADDQPWQQQVRWDDQRAQPLDPQSLELLRRLLAIVRQQGKEPVLLIEPTPLVHTLIREDIASLLQVRTLYMNQMAFADDEIADRNHLNAKGGRRVSLALAKYLDSD